MPTKAERDAKWEADVRAHLPTFKARLQTCASLPDAIALLNAAVPESSPGRVYYRNLGALLHFNILAPAVTGEEIRLYRGLTERIASEQPKLADVWRRVLDGGA
ncbi:MAG TPA: hypothetical protein VJT73_19835 [Polyangiaceae bacterium]|nr:hypothetical protein [Polyangiaceae bacterium]